MTRCHGTTVEGERCKRDAPEGERYCYLHADQAGSGGVRDGLESIFDGWTGEDYLKAALGLGVLGVIVLLRLRR